MSTATTGAVREAHRFDEGALASYLTAAIDGFAGPLTVTQFKGGQSNPTFLLATPAAKYVLRKKPPGTLLPSAHAIEREYQAISALAGCGVPVPRARHLCEDAGIIGTPFYVMDHLDGRVFKDPTLPDQAPAERTAIYDAMNDALAKLHGVDYVAAGLANFGKPGNYYQRQISRWGQQYEAAKTEPNADMDRLMAWLPGHIPPEDKTGIAQGDFRLENLIFHPSEPRVLAVLDWELATLGPPLADLAYCCLVYHVSLPNQRGFADGVPAGIPSEAAFVEAYARRTGRTAVTHWNFYLAFALFRIAAIAAGVYRRGLQGNNSDDMALRFGEVLRITAAAGWQLAQKSG